MWIYSWNFRSGGARLLADYLDAYLIRHEGSRYKGRPNKVVINWGASTLPDEVHKSSVLNGSQRVAFMTDKLKFFQLCKNAWRQPNFTTQRDVAETWRRSGFDVVARTILQGHSGAGIVLYSPDRPNDPVGEAPLYVKYIPKKYEYRVHCVRIGTGAETFIQRKARARDVPDNEVNWQIRNLAGGFVYVLCDDAPEDVVTQAQKAFIKTGLDFGAVDVIWNEKRGKGYVLEINTAPGLEERTAGFYAAALQRRAGEVLRQT